MDVWVEGERLAGLGSARDHAQHTLGNACPFEQFGDGVSSADGSLKVGLSTPRHCL